MEEVTSLINEKILLIECFIALSLRREKVQYVASTLMKEAKELHLLVDKVQKAVKEDLEKVNEHHGILINRMRVKQDAIIKYVIAERRRKMQEAELRDQEMRAAVTASNVPGTAEKIPASVMLKCMNGLKLQSNVFTPITLSNYKNSPMVKHRPINPIPFKFLDFEYRITVEQFESIPKYMRGRESIDELRNFLDTVVVPCFNKKYQLIHRQRSTVRNRHDLELWKVYNQQASYVPGERKHSFLEGIDLIGGISLAFVDKSVVLVGRNFITAGDISQQMQKMLDKKKQNRLVMLKHLGVLQEQRVGQTVCYIWNADAH